MIGCFFSFSFGPLFGGFLVFLIHRWFSDKVRWVLGLSKVLLDFREYLG